MNKRGGVKRKKSGPKSFGGEGCATATRRKEERGFHGQKNNLGWSYNKRLRKHVRCMPRKRGSGEAGLRKKVFLCNSCTKVDHCGKGGKRNRLQGVMFSGGFALGEATVRVGCLPNGRERGEKKKENVLTTKSGGWRGKNCQRQLGQEGLKPLRVVTNGVGSRPVNNLVRERKKLNRRVGKALPNDKGRKGEGGSLKGTHNKRLMQRGSKRSEKKQRTATVCGFRLLRVERVSV